MIQQLDGHHDDTRAVLHRIANHVLARAEYRATDRISRRATPDPVDAAFELFRTGLELLAS